MTNIRNPLKILFAGGGTGGHLFPAIALAEELQSRYSDDEVDILFVGSKHGLEYTLLPSLKYRLKTIWISGFHRGRSLKIILKNLLLPLKAVVSYIQSYRILKSYAPEIVFGTGGYVEAIPLYAATQLGIRAFIHEQNSYPGVTSRWLDERVDRVYLAFEESAQYFRNDSKVVYGNPLRGSLAEHDRNTALTAFKLSPEKKTVFVFGGSQGAHAINRYFIEHISAYLKKDIQFIWQTGRFDFDAIFDQYGTSDNIALFDFILEMDQAYAAADVCVCRAGALTVAELAFLGKAAVLVPLPSAANDHQRQNALACVSRNAARMVLQSELDTGKMENTIHELLSSEELRHQVGENIMKMAHPEAARNIINDILDRYQHDI